MPDLRLGLDVGTTAVKAAAYDSAGQLLATEERASPVSTGQGGRSEQDMDEVWSSTSAVLHALSGRLPDHRAVSLGICAQGDGLWPIQADGTPAGPAMLWNDTRAAADTMDLIETGGASAVGRACHTALWPGASGALWRWICREDPAMRDRTSNAVTCGDWIGFKLTGALSIDFSNASIPFLDIRTRSYSDEALTALGCADLGPRLPAPRSAASGLGGVMDSAAAATGLPEGLPVSVPTLDLAAMMIGMGMERPGQTMLIMGTTAVVCALTDGVTKSDHPVGASVLHPTSDAIIRALAPTTGASAFDWFTGLHPQSLAGESAGEVADKLNQLVVDVPPGANGVTFLPYLNGERAPFVSPEVTASFHGLTARSTTADMGRAVMEASAMSLRHCFEAEDGLPTEPVLLTGGGSKNPVWCQIIADVIGAPIVVSEAADQGLWGAACLGAAAAGLGDVADLVKRTEQTRRYEHDADNHRAYENVYARYRTLSDAARAMADLPT